MSSSLRRRRGEVAPKGSGGPRESAEELRTALAIFRSLRERPPPGFAGAPPAELGEMISAYSPAA